MNDTNILELLQKNYNINMNSITINRKGGCVSYLVNSGNKKHFLKMIDNAFSDTAIQSIDIHKHLIKNGFPIPKIIRTKDNLPHFIYENQLFVLYEYIDGVEPNLDDKAEKIGELVGKLNKLMSSYSGELTTHNKEFFVDRYIDILRKKHYPDEKLNEYIEIGNSLWDSVKDMPYGFCHGDLHRGNLLQTADNTIYMLDFDTVCFAPQLFDIAVMCDTTDYFNFDKNEFQHTTDIFHRFMNEYSKYNQIDFTIKQFYDFIALRHFQLQATIVEIYGLNCIDEKFIDKQLDWIKQWRNYYEQ
ncbi:MAG: phosphotransferase [Clostridium sp.]|nr:phosphotransferase [Clostridium sp.]